MISLIEFALIVVPASLRAAGASHEWQLLLQLKTIDPRISLRPDRKRTQVGLQPEGSIPPGKIIGIMCCVRRTLSLQKGSPSEPSSISRLKAGKLSVNVRSCPEPRSPRTSISPISRSRWIIEAAPVRWTNGYEFGIELTTLSPEAAARLRDYLQAQLPTCTAVASYELSPFSYN